MGGVRRKDAEKFLKNNSLQRRKGRQKTLQVLSNVMHASSGMT
jgi:hypothetical protein